MVGDISQYFVYLLVYCYRKEKHPLSIVLVGNDNLVSSAAQALVSSKCAPEQLRFAIIPTGEEFAVVNRLSCSFINY